MIGPFQIAAKNLVRKKTRTLLTVVGIALSAWVLVSLLGFNRGYEAALDRDIEQMGFQMLVTAKGCPYEAATMMLKGGTGLRYMEESIAAGIAGEPEVERVTSMLMQGVFDPNKGESGGVSAYIGVDPKTFPALKPFLGFREGGWFRAEGAYEAVMGYEAAELEQRVVGDKLLIPEKDVELTVVGVLKRTGTQDDGTTFLPLRTVQRIFAKEGKLTSVGIKLRKDADMYAIEERLYQLPDVQVVSLVQVKQTILGLVATARVIVFSIAVIAILIAMVGVVNTVLMSVLERVQEIGILKTVGATPWDIFRLVWIETLLLCAAGGVAGIAAAYALSKITEVLVRRVLPYAPSGGIIRIDGALAAFGLSVIAAIALLAGIYPAWRAGRVRPLEAIRGEAGR